MKTTHLFLSTAAATLLTLGATAAQASATCKDYPKNEWRPTTELEAKLVEAGWKVRRVEESCTCLQVYGTNPEGKRVEAFFDPKTLEQVEED